MEWVGGTKEAREIINELLKSGNLIDVYSKEYFKKRNDDEFYPERLNELIKEYGDELLHHLLVGHFQENHDGVMSLLNLCGINEDEDSILSPDNAPTFLFINLKTQSILLLGLWKRKAQTIEGLIYSTGKFSSSNFEELDYLFVVEEIRDAFEDVSRGIYPTLDGYSEGELECLVKGKNGNFFSDEDDANEVDENDDSEGITQEEIDERYKELKDAEELREDAKHRLQKFFPEFTNDDFWC